MLDVIAPSSFPTAALATTPVARKCGRWNWQRSRACVMPVIVVHLGNAVHLNVERRSKVGDIKGLLVKTRVELLKRRHRWRLQHGGLG
jgi:hypothetical protein